MAEFRYRYHNWFAELNSDSPEDREEMNHFFETSVKDKISDHGSVGLDSKMQRIYHVCYDCNMGLWNEIYARVTNIGTKCGVKLNWEEIRHVMRFTFIWMPPGGNLLPHTASKLRAMCAFNMPLRGKTEISFYERTPDHRPGQKLETHRYYHPNFLNVNQFHGVVNDTDDERMILKTHLLTVPWEKAMASYEGDTQVKVFDFDVPWANIRQNYEGYVKKTS